MSDVRGLRALLSGDAPSVVVLPMRICRKCGEPRVDPAADEETRVCRECELERQAAEPPLPAGASDEETAECFVRESGWRLATTMLDVPHQYTVRDLSSSDAGKTTARGHASFEWFVRHVRASGVPKRWGPYENTYLVVGEWEYWTMGYPVENTTIVNRQAVGPRARRYMDSQVAEALAR